MGGHHLSVPELRKGTEEDHFHFASMDMIEQARKREVFQQGF
jgi:hypothetical protein